MLKFYIPHYSFLIPHYSFLITHSSLLIWAWAPKGPRPLGLLRLLGLLTGIGRNLEGDTLQHGGLAVEFFF